MSVLSSVLGVDPGVLTLGQMFWMANARRQHNWQLARTIVWITAEVNQDRKRRRKPFRPNDFNPCVTTKPAPARAFS